MCSGRPAGVETKATGEKWRHTYHINSRSERLNRPNGQRQSRGHIMIPLWLMGRVLDHWQQNIEQKKRRKRWTDRKWSEVSEFVICISTFVQQFELYFSSILLFISSLPHFSLFDPCLTLRLSQQPNSPTTIHSSRLRSSPTLETVQLMKLRLN